MLARLLSRWRGADGAPSNNVAPPKETPGDPVRNDAVHSEARQQPAQPDSALPRVVAAPGENNNASLVYSRQGLFIVNRHDGGVGWQLRTRGSYDDTQMAILQHLARAVPQGGVILDIGANIGVSALLMAQAAGTQTRVHAFEAQPHIFNMLAGNMALNGVDNVTCVCSAVGAAEGQAQLPRLDYGRPASFGSVELNRAEQSDAYQHAIAGEMIAIPLVCVDGYGLPRVDLMKIDVEGMESDVLAGAMQTLRTQHPMLHIEYAKSGKEAIWKTLSEIGYRLYDVQDNFVCLRADDPRIAHLVGNQPDWRP